MGGAIKLFQVGPGRREQGGGEGVGVGVGVRARERGGVGPMYHHATSCCWRQQHLAACVQRAQFGSPAGGGGLLERLEPNVKRRKGPCPVITRTERTPCHAPLAAGHPQPASPQNRKNNPTPPRDPRLPPKPKGQTGAWWRGADGRRGLGPRSRSSRDGRRERGCSLLLVLALRCSACIHRQAYTTASWPASMLVAGRKGGCWRVPQYCWCGMGRGGGSLTTVLLLPGRAPSSGS